MYTGIVKAVRPLFDVRAHIGHTQFVVDFTDELLADLKIGASVSVEGTCMTVTGLSGPHVTFEAMAATLNCTNLRRVKSGDCVNIERSAKVNEEVGGHLMAGHVATTAEVVELSISDEGAFIRFRVPAKWVKYIFSRGFLGVNGCSLTVADVADDIVTVNLIPETLRQTTFASYSRSDLLNIEVDHQTMVLVDVVERAIANGLSATVPASHI